MEEIELLAEREATEIWNNTLKADFTNYLHNALNNCLNQIKNEINNLTQTSNSLNDKNSSKSEVGASVNQLPPITNVPKNNRSSVTNDLRAKFLGPDLAQIPSNNPVNNQNPNPNNNQIPNPTPNPIPNPFNITNNEPKKMNLNAINNNTFRTLILPNESNPLINLALHCLSNIKPFVNIYFNQLTEQKLNQLNPNTLDNLGLAFHRLLENYWDRSKNMYNMYTYTPNDIHEILKKNMKNLYMNQSPGLIFNKIFEKLNMDLGRRNQIINNYINNKTILENCLYNIIYEDKICEVCQRKNIFIKSLPIIDLHIKANMNFNNNCADLFSLIKFKDKIFENCTNCNNFKYKDLSFPLYDLSDIVIFNINREYDQNNISIYLNFPENFLKYNIIINPVGQNNFYELIGIIEKKIINNNNFILHFKSFVDNNWYCYENNQIIRDINRDSKNINMLIYQIKKN